MLRAWLDGFDYDGATVKSVSFDGLNYYAFGSSSLTPGKIAYDYYSSNGVDWLRWESGMTSQENDIILQGGRAIVVGLDGIRASQVYLSPFDAWARERLPEAAMDSLAPEADPDGDGVPNIGEYAHGRDAGSADGDEGMILYPALSDDNARFSFVCRSDDEKLTVRLYVAEGLESFESHPLAFNSADQIWGFESDELALEFTDQLVSGLWRLTFVAKKPLGSIFARVGVAYEH